MESRFITWIVLGWELSNSPDLPWRLCTKRGVYG